MSIFRQTGQGVSNVNDAYGKQYSRIDSFAPETKGFASVHIVETPIGSLWRDKQQTNILLACLFDDVWKICIPANYSADFSIRCIHTLQIAIAFEGAFKIVAAVFDVSQYDISTWVNNVNFIFSRRFT